MQSINIKRAEGLEQQRIEAIEEKTGARIIEIMDRDRQRNTLAGGVYLTWQVIQKICTHLGVTLQDLGIDPAEIAQAEEWITAWEQIQAIRVAGKQAENDKTPAEEYAPRP